MEMWRSGASPPTQRNCFILGPFHTLSLHLTGRFQAATQRWSRPCLDCAAP
jgi:hypothetical protein